MGDHDQGRPLVEEVDPHRLRGCGDFLRLREFENAFPRKGFNSTLHVVMPGAQKLGDLPRGHRQGLARGEPGEDIASGLAERTGYTSNTAEVIGEGLQNLAAPYLLSHACGGTLMTAPRTLNGDILFGAQAIADFLGRSRRSVYYWCALDRLPHFKVSSVICARKSTLVTWIKNQETRKVE